MIIIEMVSVNILNHRCILGLHNHLAAKYYFLSPLTLSRTLSLSHSLSLSLPLSLSLSPSPSPSPPSLSPSSR